MTAEDVERLDRCLEADGVALFPADTVYGLAASAESAPAVERLYGLKGRRAGQPAAVMFFSLARAFEAVPELGPRTRAAAERLMPGGVTLVVPNPRRRYPLACGPTPERLGLRVPALTAALEPLRVVSQPVLQSSANPAGAPAPRRLDDVDPRLRAEVDIEVDGGELPGTASTVVDLTRYEDGGAYEVLRDGAVPRGRLGEVL